MGAIEGFGETGELPLWTGQSGDGWSVNEWGELYDPSGATYQDPSYNYNVWEFGGSDPTANWQSWFPSSYDQSGAPSSFGSGDASVVRDSAGNVLSPTTGGGASTAGLGSVLSGMLGASGGGSNSGMDLSRLLGTLGAAGLGYMGSKEQSEAYERLAREYMNMGAPYRQQLANLYTPEGVNSFLTSAPVTTSVDQGTKALSRALSVNGNPTGSGAALSSIQDYATKGLYGQLANERQQLANFGGLSAFASAAPQAQAAGINAGAGAWNSLGYGVGQAFNPQPTLTDIIRELRGGGGQRIA